MGVLGAPRLHTVGMWPIDESAPRRGSSQIVALSSDLVEVITMPQVYCVKCKAKKEAIDTKKVTMKNGKPALEGKCPTCGTKVFKIGG